MSIFILRMKDMGRERNYLWSEGQEMEGQALIAGWYRAYTFLHDADCLCSHLQLTEERTTAQRGHLVKTHRGGTASEPGVDRAEVCTLPQCWGNTLQTLVLCLEVAPEGCPESAACWANGKHCLLITCDIWVKTMAIWQD